MKRRYLCLCLLAILLSTLAFALQAGAVTRVLFTVSPTHLRQIATGTNFPNTNSASFTDLNSSTPHCARDDITSIQAVYANAWGLNESSAGTATLTLGIENPAGSGTFVTLTFGTVRPGTIAPGALIISDPLPIKIANGTKFNMRSHYHNSAGIIFYSLPFADSQILADTSATDKTLGGTLPPSVNALMPVALIAYTRVNAVAVIGDSIGYGTFAGANSDTCKDIGVFNASLGPGGPVLNLAAAGEFASNLYAHYVIRRQLLQYVTGAVVEDGNNDIQTGLSTPAQLDNDLQVIPQWPELSGKKLILSTLFPKVTNSGNFLTRASQTPWPTESQRLAANTLIRAGVLGYAGVADFASVMEGTTIGTDLSTWTVNGSNQALPQDGTHPTVVGAIFGAASGVLNAGMFQ